MKDIVKEDVLDQASMQVPYRDHLFIRVPPCALINRWGQETFYNKPFSSFRDRMLYLVGLGLADETDITVRGLEVVKKAERVYLEAYTSILLVDKEKLVRSPATYPLPPFTYVVHVS
jgi:hypothetical protein